MDERPDADARWFDDLAVGDAQRIGPYTITDAEMRAFSQQWDPLPIHVDDEFAARTQHGCVIGSGIYTLAVKQHLLANHASWRRAVIGAAGYDELRFPRPVRAGDSLTFVWEIVDARPSRSKPDRGIVRFRMRMLNQDDETVLDYFDTVVLARRPRPARS